MWFLWFDKYVQLVGRNKHWYALYYRLHTCKRPFFIQLRLEYGNSGGCICKQNFHSPAINSEHFEITYTNWHFQYWTTQECIQQSDSFFLILSQSSTVQLLNDTCKYQFFNGDLVSFISKLRYGALQNRQYFLILNIFQAQEKDIQISCLNFLCLDVLHNAWHNANMTNSLLNLKALRRDIPVVLGQ